MNLLFIPPLGETCNLTRGWLKWNAAKWIPVMVDQAERKPSWDAKNGIIIIRRREEEC